MSTIYLDYNASTPLLAEVAAAMQEVQEKFPGNPSSQHQFGRRARARLEDAREALTKLLGGRPGSQHPDRLLLTSGGTEANNLALWGLAGGRGRVLISAQEHASVTSPAEELRRRGACVEVIRVTPAGQVDLGHLESLLAAGPTSLVSVMLVNNDTGAVQPVAEAARRARAAGALIHTDACQAVGRMPVSLEELQVDALSLAAHKFHGPHGIGGLLLRSGVTLARQIHGGPQEFELRAGTEPLSLAVGMQVALETWQRDAAQRAERVAGLQRSFESQLLRDWPELVIHAAASARVPGTTCVAFPGLDRQALLVALDLAGIACSSGSACSSGAAVPSPALVAMGLDSELVESSVRFSYGAPTGAGELTEAARRIIHCAKQLRLAAEARISGREPRETRSKTLE